MVSKNIKICPSAVVIGYFFQEKFGILNLRYTGGLDVKRLLLELGATLSNSSSIVVVMLLASYCFLLCLCFNNRKSLQERILMIYLEQDEGYRKISF